MFKFAFLILYINIIKCTSIQQIGKKYEDSEFLEKLEDYKILVRDKEPQKTASNSQNFHIIYLTPKHECIRNKNVKLDILTSNDKQNKYLLKNGNFSFEIQSNQNYFQMIDNSQSFSVLSYSNPIILESTHSVTFNY